MLRRNLLGLPPPGRFCNTSFTQSPCDTTRFDVSARSVRALQHNHSLNVRAIHGQTAWKFCALVWAGYYFFASKFTWEKVAMYAQDAGFAIKINGKGASAITITASPIPMPTQAKWPGTVSWNTFSRRPPVSASISLTARPCHWSSVQIPHPVQTRHFIVYSQYITLQREPHITISHRTHPRTPTTDKKHCSFSNNAETRWKFFSSHAATRVGLASWCTSSSSTSMTVQQHTVRQPNPAHTGLQNIDYLGVLTSLTFNLIWFSDISFPCTMYAFQSQPSPFPFAAAAQFPPPLTSLLPWQPPLRYATHPSRNPISAIAALIQ